MDQINDDHIDRAIADLYGTASTPPEREASPVYSDELLARAARETLGAGVEAGPLVFDRSPDEVAADRRRSAALGVPEPVSDAERRLFEEEEERRRRQELRRAAPGTNRFLADPRNAAIARDQLEDLAALEQRVAEAAAARDEANTAARDQADARAELTRLTRERERAERELLAARVLQTPGPEPIDGGSAARRAQVERRAALSAEFPGVADAPERFEAQAIAALAAYDEQIADARRRAKYEQDPTALLENLDERFLERLQTFEIRDALIDEETLRQIEATGRVGGASQRLMRDFLAARGHDDNVVTMRRYGTTVYELDLDGSARSEFVAFARAQNDPRARVAQSMAQISELRARLVEGDFEPGSVTELAAEALVSVAENAPTFVAALALRAPSLMMADIGVRGFASGFQRAYDLSEARVAAGGDALTLEEVQFVGVAYALAEALPERLSFGAILKVLDEAKRGVVSGVVSGAISGAAASIPVEGATEALTSLAQSGIDVALLDQDVSVDEAIEQAVRDGTIGAIAGAVMGGVGGAVSGRADAVRVASEDARTRAVEREAQADASAEAAAAELEGQRAAIAEHGAKLRERDPAAVVAHAEEALRGTGRETVEIPIDAIDDATGPGKLFQDTPDADAWFERKLGVAPGALKRARARRGASVTVRRSAAIAAELEVTEAQWLVDHFKADADSESRADRRVARQRRSLEETQRRARAGVDTAESTIDTILGDFGADVRAIYDEEVRRLRQPAPTPTDAPAQALYTEGTARTQAIFNTLFSAVMADRFGGKYTPRDLYDRFFRGVAAVDEGQAIMRPAEPDAPRLTGGQVAEIQERDRRARERDLEREQRDADRGVGRGRGQEFVIEDDDDDTAPAPRDIGSEALPPARAGRATVDMEAARAGGRLREALDGLTDAQASAYANRLRPQFSSDLDAISDPREFVERVAAGIEARNVGVDGAAERAAARADYELAVATEWARLKEEQAALGEPVTSLVLKAVPPPDRDAAFDRLMPDAARDPADDLPIDVTVEVLPIPARRHREIVERVGERFALSKPFLLPAKEIRGAAGPAVSPAMFRVSPRVTAVVIGPDRRIVDGAMTYARLLAAGATEIPVQRIVDAPTRRRLTEPEAVYETVLDALTRDGVKESDAKRRARAAQEYAYGQSQTDVDGPGAGGARAVLSDGDVAGGEARAADGDQRGPRSRVLGEMQRRGDAAAEAERQRTGDARSAPERDDDGELDQLIAARNPAVAWRKQLAQEMIASGESASDVWRATYMRLGEDGEIEEMIRPSSLQIRPAAWSAAAAPGGVVGRLADLVDHPDLFAIPRFAFLRDLPITIAHSIKRRGAIGPNGIKVEAPTLSDALVILAHEIQHATDLADGRKFTPGSSPDVISYFVISNFYVQEDRVETHLNTEAGEDFLLAFVKRWPDVMVSSQILINVMALRGFPHLSAGRLPRAVDPREALDWLMTNRAAVALYENMREDKYLKPTVLQVFNGTPDPATGETRNTRFEAYRHITGEIRAKMAEEARGQAQDDIDPDTLPSAQMLPQRIDLDHSMVSIVRAALETLDAFSRLVEQLQVAGEEINALSRIKQQFSKWKDALSHTVRFAKMVLTAKEMKLIEKSLKSASKLSSQNTTMEITGAIDDVIVAFYPINRALSMLEYMDEAAIIKVYPEMAPVDIRDFGKGAKPGAKAKSETADADAAATDPDGVLSIDLGPSGWSAPDGGHVSLTVSGKKPAAAERRRAAVDAAVTAATGVRVSGVASSDETGQWGPVIATRADLGEVRVSSETIWKAGQVTNAGKHLAVWTDLATALERATLVGIVDDYAVIAARGGETGAPAHKLQNHRALGLVRAYTLELLAVVDGTPTPVTIVLRERLREDGVLHYSKARARREHPRWQDHLDGQDVPTDLYLYAIRSAPPERRDIILKKAAARSEANTNETPERERARGQDENTPAPGVGQESGAEIDGELEQRASGSSQTETDAFRRWFGASQVVDAQGEPLVVYHGTGETFSRFDPDEALDGFFFAADPEVANWYAGGKAPNVMPVFLRMENPRVVDFRGARYSASRMQREVKKALAEGSDGLIVRNILDEAKGGDAVQTQYAVFDATQIKSATGNRGTFDPRDPSIVAQNGARSDRRGFFDLRTRVIKLTNARDLSTYLHESGHAWFAAMSELALEPDAPKQLRDDFDAVLKYTGLTLDDVTGKTLTERYRAGHEKFAQALELYLREGRAPTRQLAGVFARVASWFVTVYGKMSQIFGGQSLIDHDVDMRRIFDRLLATERQIQTAAERSGFHRMFGSAADYGMAPAAFKAMREAEDAAVSEAVERAITAALILHGDEARAIHAQRIEEEMPNARDRVRLRQEYRAIDAIESGRIAPLSRDEIAEAFPDFDLAALPRSILTRKRPVALYPSLEAAAAALGFDTPVAMVEALTAPARIGRDVAAAARRVLDARARRQDAESRGAVETDARLAAEVAAEAEAAGVDARAAESERRDLRKRQKAAMDAAAPALEILRAKGAKRLDARQLRELVETVVGAGGTLDVPMSELLPSGAGGAPIYAVPRTDVADLDVAAQILGWPASAGGARAMLDALAAAPPFEDAARADAEQAMAATDPDRLTLDEGPVVDFLHGEAQQLALELQVEAAAQGAGLPGLTKQNAKAIAQDMMGQEPVKLALQLSHWLQAERRAAAKAEEAQGKLQLAARRPRQRLRTPALFEVVLRWKEAQLLNMRLVAESRAVTKDVEALKRKTKRLHDQIKRLRSQKPSEIKKNTIHADYLTRIEALFEQYRLAPVPATRRRELNAYLQWRREMMDAGREAELTDFPPRLEVLTRTTSILELTVDELRGLIDALENLEHLGSLKTELLKRARERERQKRVQTLITGVEKRARRARPKPKGGAADARLVGATTDGEGRAGWMSGFWMSIMDIATIVQGQLDDGDAYGPAWQILGAPIEKGMRELHLRIKAAAERWDELNSVYSRRDWRRMARKAPVPGAPALVMSHEDRLAFALNWGAESNRDAIRNSPTFKGREDLIDAILDTLDARDIAYVNSVWRYIEGFRPEIAAKARRLTGVEPEWIEASPAVVKHGRLDGGYYPLKYNDGSAYGVFDAEAGIEGNLLQGESPSRRGKAGTRADFLKKRVQGHGRDVLLDLGVRSAHVNSVIYDLVLGEPVAEISAVISDRDYRQAMAGAGRGAALLEIDTWLRDIAKGPIAWGDAWNKAARIVGSNFVFSRLAWNLTSAVIQPTSLVQSWVVLGLGKGDMLAGVAQALNPARVRKAYADSRLLRERAHVQNVEVAKALRSKRYNPIRLLIGDQAATAMLEYGYAPMALLQRVADLPTYLAGYRQGLRKFKGDHDRAVAYAEKLLQTSQVGQSDAYISGFQRGSVGSYEQSDVIAALSRLGSYMLTKPRILTLKAQDVRYAAGAGAKAVATADLVASAFMLYSVETILTVVLLQLLHGDDWFDEARQADTSLETALGAEDSALGEIARDTVYAMLGSIPMLNVFAREAQGFRGGGLPPEQALAEFARLFNQAEQGEADLAAARAAMSAVGYLAPFPSAQASKTFEAGWRAMDGEDVPPQAFLVGVDRD